MADIGKERNAYIAIADDIPHTVCAVVRHRKGGDRKIADTESLAHLYHALVGHWHLGLDTIVAVNAMMHAGSSINRKEMVTAQTAHRLDMVGMIVGNNNGRDVGKGQAVVLEILLDGADTHTGIARDSRTLAELESCDLIPFAAGIQAGCGAVMVGHVIMEALDGSLPASLSPAVHAYLRENMGYDGVIMTDDLVMQAITDQYGAGEAAVMAVLAGNDLLCSTEYTIQYEAVLQAVLDGRIDIDTLNAAVRRVLQWKSDLGLLNISYG